MTNKLDDLLSRLPSVEKSPQALSYEGKAVSRDKDNVHLAISSGVVAIRLADIVDVTTLAGQSDDIMSVTVKQLDGIKQIPPGQSDVPSRRIRGRLRRGYLREFVRHLLE